MNKIWKALRRLDGVDLSRVGCRRCGDAIPTRDHFGVSESVCVPCRRDYNR